MELRNLTSFRAVAMSLSLTRAAAEFGYVQSALDDMGIRATTGWSRIDARLHKACAGLGGGRAILPGKPAHRDFATARLLGIIARAAHLRPVMTTDEPARVGVRYLGGPTALLELGGLLAATRTKVISSGSALAARKPEPPGSTRMSIRSAGAAARRRAQGRSRWDETTVRRRHPHLVSGAHAKRWGSAPGVGRNLARSHHVDRLHAVEGDEGHSQLAD